MSVFDKIPVKKIKKATAYKAAGLVLAGALALGMIGCGEPKPSPYAFNDKIGTENVIYDDNLDENTGILTIQKPNGDTFVFVDKGRNKSLESYTFKLADGSTETYERDEVGSSVILDAEKVFRNYLLKIKEIRVNKADGSFKGLSLKGY